MLFWWTVCFNLDAVTETEKLYLKAGEYGETELDNRWSVFREPLNSWSSLFFSFFGVFIFVNFSTTKPPFFNIPLIFWPGLIAIFTGLRDLYQNPDPKFALAAEPGFSIAFGVCAVYLGDKMI